MPYMMGQMNHPNTNMRFPPQSQMGPRPPMMGNPHRGPGPPGQQQPTPGSGGFQQIPPSGPMLRQQHQQHFDHQRMRFSEPNQQQNNIKYNKY